MQAFNPNNLLPNLEFFQNMLKGSAMPSGLASWMAPTLDPAELEQKITDLKAVLHWLEANCRLTQATIQGLEVQRMTLSALQTMNVDMNDLASRMGDAMQAGARAAAQQAPAAAPDTAAPAAASAEAEPAAQPGGLDPMQWWNAVSQQFTEVASQALRDNPWPMPGAAPSDAPAAPRAAAKPAATATRAATRAAKPAAKKSARAKPATSTRRPRKA